MAFVAEATEARRSGVLPPVRNIGFKRKVTSWQQLRRRVNELIPGVNFTARARGESGARAADIG